MAGRTATTVDLMEATTEIMKGSFGLIKALEATAKALENSHEATTRALVDITEKIKLAQQETETMFINSEE